MSFFFSDPPPPDLYTLSLHDALPICNWGILGPGFIAIRAIIPAIQEVSNSRILAVARDRKSTRLNSSHTVISYAVFCLKKKIHATRTGRSERAIAQAP